MTVCEQPNVPRGARTAAQARGSVQRWVIPGLIAVVVFAAYLPVLRAGFVNWDDDHTVVNNPHLRHLGKAQLLWMFTASHAGHYQPLTWLSLALDYRLWGLDRPGGFHLTSLVLHVLTALAVYLLAGRLMVLAYATQASRAGLTVRAGAAVAALLFAVHPLRVESVAWITERRDVLAGLFFVLSLLVYVKAARSLRDGHPHSAWYAGSIALCALSLLCKAYAVTLVGVLVLLDAYPLGRFTHHRLRPLVGKAPFVVLSVVFGLLAIRAQKQAGALYPLESYDVAGRVAQALYGHAFYLAKLVLPVSLGPLYELPSRDALVGGHLWIGVVVFVGVGVAAVLLRGRFKFFPLAWGWYLIVLLPVSGLLQSGVQLSADRYTYLSCIGWAVAAGAAVYRLLAARSDSTPRVILIVGGAGAVIVMFGVLTWRQSTIWRDSQALWQRGVAVSPNSAIAHANLGDALMHQDQPDPAAARRSYLRALELNPRDAKAHNGAAAAALAQDQPETALRHLESAVLLDPQYAFAHYNLGRVLAGYGRFDGAIERYRAAVNSDPTFAQAASALADLLIDRGRFAEAIESLRSAVGRLPEDAYFHSTLSWLLATCPDDGLREGPAALAHATVACRLTADGDPWALDSRAAALAQLRRFDEAVATAQNALAAAQAQDRAELADQIKRRIGFYRAKRAYRMGM